jgi:hypothetical protein
MRNTPKLIEARLSSVSKLPHQATQLAEDIYFQFEKDSEEFSN